MLAFWKCCGTVAFKRPESICLRPECVCESQWLNRKAAGHFIIKDMQNARVKLLTCLSSVSLSIGIQRVELLSQNFASVAGLEQVATLPTVLCTLFLFAVWWCFQSLTGFNITRLWMKKCRNKKERFNIKDPDILSTKSSWLQPKAYFCLSCTIHILE